MTEKTPVHASVTIIRQRLSDDVFHKVFLFVLEQLKAKKLLKGKTLGVDATTLEANAAMRRIVRKGTGEDWKEYLRELAKKEGIENPTDEDIQRIDRGRKGKKVSNKEWQSKTDPDSCITKMKDGRTHLAYKAEHSVNLETEADLCCHVTHADQSNTTTGPESLILTEANLQLIESERTVVEAVMDKGYTETHCWKSSRSGVSAPTFQRRNKRIAGGWINRNPTNTHSAVIHEEFEVTRENV